MQAEEGKSRIFGLIWVLSNSAVGEKKKKGLQATGVLVVWNGGWAIEGGRNKGRARPKTKQGR